ncbi:translocation/assembly module TamB domain-containing protein [Phycobacter sp. K97]|uniref:translocation/assembly module TamB domain-containing protein n=1 Tax=Phycobacter sedimenti TaxID=3133977 RepID=UPI00311E6333
MRLICSFDRMSPAALAVMVATLTAPSLAQAQSDQDSGGFLVDFLEDTLSADSRYISVEGLSGALSSEAAIQRLTVADDDGVWLILEDAKLDWNRLALIQGRFSVNTLSAEAITVIRKPNPVPEDPALPTPEATPFALPDLPVAVELGEIRVSRFDLGADLLGQPASLSMKGALTLADGALSTRLDIDRLDKPGDRVTLIAGYADATRQIDLDLALSESSDGLISAALDLPGRPTLQLTAKGSGPVSDFEADITLSSNGQERLAGQVVLAALPQPEPGPDAQADAGNPAASTIGFSAALSGDIDPLLRPDYRPFFGPELRLVARGRTEASGGLSVDTLALNTQALRLTGSLASAAEGGLGTANLKATITPPNGNAAIILPVPGASTTLAGAELALQKTADGQWTVSGDLRDLSRPELTLANAALRASGTMAQAGTDTEGSRFDGRLRLDLSGLALRDAALAAAVGDRLELESKVTTQGPSAISLTELELRGADYQLAGDAAFSGLESGLEISADVAAGASDLSRFSALAQRPIGGAVQASVKGRATPLWGGFDADVSLVGQDLSTGIDQVDTLLSGTVTTRLVAARGAEGLRIDRFELDGESLSARAQGALSSNSGSLTATARLDGLERLLPEAPGSLELSADLSRSGDTISGQARLKGPRSSSATLDGDVQLSGDAAFTFDAILNELERFVPELAGAVEAKGRAERRGGLWQIGARATAPAQTTVDVAGTYSESTGIIDAKASGDLRLEGANPFIKPNLAKGPARFDMAIKGPPALDSVSGTILTTGSVLALPSAGQRIENINASISLQNSGAQVQITASPGDSGTLRISGPIALAPPFQSDLGIEIVNLVLSDHLSYETLLNGRLRLKGALAGNSSVSGRIDVGETNINLNTAAGSVTAAPIPQISHIGASQAVQATRARAGLIETAQGQTSSRTSQTTLDVVIDAPGKVFARGRGLRAELGGRILLRGSTRRISPSGQIGLIRGSFDILGRRLSLDEGQITLLGNLTPFLDFSSSAQTEQGSATLRISGLIDAPQIVVTSEPPRPSEEALALLLFGDNIKDLSPLALARLASSVLTLSGRSGNATERLRSSTGADDADIGLDKLGAGQLGLGGYISENLYTDVDVNTRGESELSLNLDISESLTVTGKVDSVGESGLGILFKRDY